MIYRAALLGRDARDRATGLAGWPALQARLRRLDGPVAMVLLRLDGLEGVAVRQGRSVVDTILAHATARLRGAAPSTAVLARLDRDAFALLLPGAQPDQAIVVAGRLVAACAVPFSVAGSSLTLSASAGTALHSGTAPDPDLLLRQATAALHQARAEGGGVHRFFKPGIDLQTRQHLALQAELRRALRHQQFELDYQPQFDILTGRPCGVEALLRWRHPEMGVVAPNDFIGTAEQCGLIVPIGQWVCRVACAQAAAWPGLQLSVNLSPIQLRAPGLVQDVTDALAASGLEPSRLDLEITEGVFLHDTPFTVMQLERLRALGVGITLDDFGTGYSSLSYLRMFPFTKLKVDRSFVAPATADRAAACIIGAMINLGRTLGMRVNAEGVETPAQLRLLQNAGCDEVQGFLLARPMRAQQISDLLGALGPTTP